MINESTINKPRIENKIRNFIVCFSFDNCIGDDNAFSFLIGLFILVVDGSVGGGKGMIPFKQSLLQLIFSIESGIGKFVDDTSVLNSSLEHCS